MTRTVFPMRLWAILHYLDRNADQEERRRMFRLTSYLRTNDSKAKEAVRVAEKKGWLIWEQNTGVISITEPGRRYLGELRRAMEPLYSEQIDYFEKPAK